MEETNNKMECTSCENLAKTYHKNKLISYHEK